MYDTQLVELIDTIVKQGGSDIHLTAGYHPTIRVSGLLIPLVARNVLTPDDTKGFAEALLTPENRELFWRDKEIDFSYSYQNDAVRFRGNCSFSRGTVSIALRLIPKNISSIQELGLPASLAEFVR